MHDRRRQAVADLAVRHAREMSDLMEGGLGAAREKFKELVTFELEWIDNEDLKKEWEETGDKGDLPFFSEMALYSLLGKDNARSVLARINILGEALGFTRMEIHRDFKSDDDEREEKDHPSQDDLDALEVILRDEAAHLFHRDPEKQIIPLMRTLGLMREMVGAHPFGEGVEYVRCYPKDLKIGDRIAMDGRWVDVHGFFTQSGKPCEKPRADRVKDSDSEVYDRKLRKSVKRAYWGAHVKISADSEHGHPLRSQDQHIVQRQVHPEGIDKPSEDA